MNEASAGSQDLHKEVAQIRFVMVLLLCVGLGLLTLMNLAAVTAVPRFERIFEEMLGSRDKLPQLTQFVVSYGRMAAGLGAYAVTLMLPGLAVLGLLLGARTRIMPLFCVAVMAFQVVHWLVVTVALYAPLVSIIEGVGERTE